MQFDSYPDTGRYYLYERRAGADQAKSQATKIGLRSTGKLGGAWPRKSLQC